MSFCLLLQSADGHFQFPAPVYGTNCQLHGVSYPHCLLGLQANFLTRRSYSDAPFVPSSPIGISGGIVFSGCPCVHASVRVRVQACVRKRLLARYLTNQWVKFHQTLIDDAIQATDELSSFWRSTDQGQGRYNATCETSEPHYLLNGLKDHSQIWGEVKIEVVTRSNIWVIAADGGVHIDAWAYKCHLIDIWHTYWCEFSSNLRAI